MKRLTSIFLALAILTGIQCGCATTASTASSNYLTEAVTKSFSDIFDGTWSGVTIYVEKSPWVPSDLKNAGKNAAEITTRDELTKRFQDSETAPAIAVVGVKENPDGTVRVNIQYVPLQIKGVKSETKGGSFEYTYKIVDGNPVLVSRLKSMN